MAKKKAASKWLPPKHERIAYLAQRNGMVAVFGKRGSVKLTPKKASR